MIYDERITHDFYLEVFVDQARREGEGCSLRRQIFEGDLFQLIFPG